MTQPPPGDPDAETAADADADAMTQPTTVFPVLEELDVTLSIRSSRLPVALFSEHPYGNFDIIFGPFQQQELQSI